MCIVSKNFRKKWVIFIVKTCVPSECDEMFDFVSTPFAHRLACCLCIKSNVNCTLYVFALFLSTTCTLISELRHVCICRCFYGVLFFLFKVNMWLVRASKNWKTTMHFNYFDNTYLQYPNFFYIVWPLSSLA